MASGFPRDSWPSRRSRLVLWIAVALPQAPGFVGVYHFACREVLTALGVPKTTALAVVTFCT